MMVTVLKVNTHFLKKYLNVVFFKILFLRYLNELQNKIVQYFSWIFSIVFRTQF